MMCSTGKAIYIFDYGDHAVKAFSRSGVPIWRFGQAGTGHGEFEGASDLETDPEGRVWVADPTLDRITIIDPAGQIVRTIEHDRQIERVVPERRDSFWGLSRGRAVPYEYDSAGVLRRRVAVPAALRGVSSLSNTGWMSAAPAGGVVTAYAWADWIAVVQSSGAVRLRRGIGGRYTFPGVTRGTVVVDGKRAPMARRHRSAGLTAASTSVAGGLLFVLHPQRRIGDKAVRRTVDTYRVANGHYAGSYLLPESVEALTVHNGSFLAIVDHPAPGIRRWRWKAAP